MSALRPQGNSELASALASMRASATTASHIGEEPRSLALLSRRSAPTPKDHWQNIYLRAPTEVYVPERSESRLSLLSSSDNKREMTSR